MQDLPELKVILNELFEQIYYTAPSLRYLAIVYYQLVCSASLLATTDLFVLWYKNEKNLRNKVKCVEGD
jgi:hypothetical protein